MQRRIFSALVASMILTASFLTAQTAVAEDQSTTVQPKKFGLYTSSGCSRSFQLQASFDTLAEAFASAAEVRSRDERSMAWVATGSEKHALGLYPAFRDNLKLEGGCSVYIKQCRSGLQLYKKTKTAKEAEELVEQMRPGQNIEIVYHLPAEKSEEYVGISF